MTEVQQTPTETWDQKTPSDSEESDHKPAFAFSKVVGGKEVADESRCVAIDVINSNERLQQAIAEEPSFVPSTVPTALQDASHLQEPVVSKVQNIVKRASKSKYSKKENE